MLKQIVDVLGAKSLAVVAVCDALPYTDMKRIPEAVSQCVVHALFLDSISDGRQSLHF